MTTDGINIAELFPTEETGADESSDDRAHRVEIRLMKLSLDLLKPTLTTISNDVDNVLIKVSANNKLLVKKSDRVRAAALEDEIRTYKSLLDKCMLDLWE